MEVAVEITRSPEFRQIYAIGAIGGHSPFDFRIAFYNDSPKSFVQSGKQINVVERTVENEIILSPLAAKELLEWLGTHIRDYEAMFGEVKRPGKTVAEPKQSSPLQGYM